MKQRIGLIESVWSLSFNLLVISFCTTGCISKPEYTSENSSALSDLGLSDQMFDQSLDFELDHALPDHALPDHDMPDRDIPDRDIPDRDLTDAMTSWLPDLCDGVDDDQDDQVDEVVRGLPSRISVTFSVSTSVDPARGRIEISDRDGVSVEGSPFTGNQLSGVMLSIPSSGFNIRLILEEGAIPGLGYQVEEVRDEWDQVVEGPYPALIQGEELTLPFTDTQWFDVGDEQGGGRRCVLPDQSCRFGETLCLGGNLICYDEQPEVREECNGIDDDCDGLIDEAEGLRDIAPPCPKQDGVCSGSVQLCIGGSWVECDSNTYGEDYELYETLCDCLDNNCDGLTDGNIREGREELLGCQLSRLAELGEGRDCVVQESGQVPSGEYHFRSLLIPEEVEVEVETGVEGEACGYQGFGSCMEAGGCLTLHAARLEIRGQLNADAGDTYVSGGNCAGASGGDIVLHSDEVTISGTVRANGAYASHFNLPVGGGAAGSIRIRSEILHLMATGSIETIGGAGAFQGGTGGGAGGAGGTGGPSRNLGGGGGAGGPGFNFDGGSSDEDRPLEIFGALDLQEGGEVITRNGALMTEGVVVLGGAIIGEPPPQLQGAQITTYPLVIRLHDESRIPLAGVNVTLTQDQAGEALTYDLGATDSSGWVKSQLNPVPLFNQVGHLVTLSGLTDTTGTLLISYRDESSEATCTRQFTFTDHQVTLPPVNECDQD